MPLKIVIIFILVLFIFFNPHSPYYPNSSHQHLTHAPSSCQATTNAHDDIINCSLHGLPPPPPITTLVEEGMDALVIKFNP